MVTAGEQDTQHAVAAVADTEVLSDALAGVEPNRLASIVCGEVSAAR